MSRSVGPVESPSRLREQPVWLARIAILAIGWAGCGGAERVSVPSSPLPPSSALAAPGAEVSSAPVAPDSATAPPAAPPTDAVVEPPKELVPPETATAEALVAADPRYADVLALVRRSEWKKARKALAALVESEPPKNRTDLHLAVLSLEASLAGLDRDPSVARTKNAAVLDRWKDPHAAQAELDQEAQGATDDEKRERLRLALGAVGQATYAAAEELREAAQKIAFPTFHGAGTHDAIRRFAEKEFAAWLSKRRTATDAAEAGYRKVLDIQPAPPPRWVIAAAERSGTLWFDFAAELRKLPHEKDMSPEVANAYEDAMNAATEPFRANAQGAYRVCVSFGDRFKMKDDHTRLCQSRLVLAKP